VRIVADTNTIVSALLWRGSPHRLIAAMEDYPITFYTSHVLIDELADVLPRRKLVKVVRATGKTPAQLVAEYAGFVNLVTPASIRRTVLDDADDDAVLACALAARADLIVSGDAHLLNLKRYQGMRIVAAAEALAIVERG
jgi:putative PIN family toxin of toxin-antitoxin system